MSSPRTTLRTAKDASLCRRRQQREKVHAVHVTSWNARQSPVTVTVIEADVKGARLMFPFPVSQNDKVAVSFQDDLGQHQTREARVAWTQKLENSGKTVAGVAFDKELSIAA